MSFFLKNTPINYSKNLPADDTHVCYFLDHSFFDSKKLACLSFEIKKNRNDLFENALLLCTCHRIEAYFPFNIPEDPIKTLLGHDANFFTGKEKAYTRLTEISCGLQSVILGEKFIYYQVEQAVNALPDNHPMKTFGKSVLKNSKRIREKHNFFATEDYEGISLSLINKLVNPSEIKTLVVIGAGMLSQQVALYAEANHYSRVVMITRVAKKFRKKTRGKPYSFLICSMHTLPDDLFDAPFHCFIATTDISEEYQARLFDIIIRKNCKAVIDMSSMPAFKSDALSGKLYITMYDNFYLREVSISNSNLFPVKHLVKKEISNLQKEEQNETKSTEEMVI